MSEREHNRIPLCIRVEFRTSSSFLVSYSLNLSRGGLFIETEEMAALGTRVELNVVIPKSADIALVGHVVWSRAHESAEGPAGVGIELVDGGPDMGAVVDDLVSRYAGLSMLVLCGDRQDRTSLTRLVKSIFATAEVMQVADANVASTLMSDDVDLAIVDVDFDVEGALESLRCAKQASPPIPTVALASNQKLRDLAKAAYADEIVANPPPFGELQIALVRALSRPVTTRSQ
jgi:uncharacterized protein (TIGR02266 family)